MKHERKIRPNILYGALIALFICSMIVLYVAFISYSLSCMNARHAIDYYSDPENTQE